ncbi:ComF family protein [Actinokineospora sp. UTMC 2448]|uniref:ComF family protein n=1 Tax=Actinokineospora sp. UTMC 2448 TaxID=2268449 RepID=UPI002164EB16|nr:phosphoribosyltransferase family protein [Actinokineospora sp. UTMC 2448]UVS79422.1 DNA utilization protein GntX [Actinokineospora sp. UTMC 2448]
MTPPDSDPFQLPETPGLGNCGSCKYFASGPPWVCQMCASWTLEPAMPFFCGVCGQQLLTETAQCSNPLCTSPHRQFEFNRAIAMKTGVLDRGVRAHKYDRVTGWGTIFARVLLGYLDSHPDVAAADLIIPMPAAPLPSGATSRMGIDHSGWVIESAAIQDTRHRYPFRADPPVIIKTRATSRMASTSNYSERRTTAADIYRALQMLDPGAVQGKTVVVVDDVFTTGLTLDAVARRLREAGASVVRGVTLARQPWG